MFETKKIRKYRNGTSFIEDDSVVIEKPITVMLNGEEFATLVCSPISEKELVIGFLAGEGLIKNPDDIRDYFHRDSQGVVWVETVNPTPQIETFLCRNFTSCCGKGRPSLYYINDQNQVSPVTGSAEFSAKSILELMGKFETSSDTFRRTGGVHSAGLADDSDIIIRYEDIGRHNALDRIMGYTFLNRIDTSDKAVLLRISSEMLIKAARIGAPLLLSRSAPTVLAVDFAEEFGITIAGFIRGDSFNVYSHSDRITRL
ncbi:MAG: formate dehydrogenase family accessory protein FdhD [Spirochaetae bacterium HGW-Spirochaetae-5]|nr:MAG: formate dehydrogenase family accessory protein FdhD [Spirochaetae bacterium HGW-Spirochaetae-5]